MRDGSFIQFAFQFPQVTVRNLRDAAAFSVRALGLFNTNMLNISSEISNLPPDIVFDHCSSHFSSLLHHDLSNLSANSNQFKIKIISMFKMQLSDGK